MGTPSSGTTSAIGRQKSVSPNSHYCLHVTTGLWDLIKGCAGEADCYGDRLDARIASLDPQLRAPLTATAWLAGRDPGMEAIKADVAARDVAGH